MQTAPRIPSLLLSAPINIARAFIKLREVTGDVACLDLGRKGLDFRGIIRINSVNFALMSESEQDGVIEGFKSFLNGLSFPIQILIRNLPHNLDTYLRSMEAIEGDLSDMARDHAHFVRVLASRRALVKREYYIIVPADRQNAKTQTEAMINGQMQVKTRVEELLRQLERMGLSGKRLTSSEIVALYQSCLTPQEVHLGPIKDRMIDATNKLKLLATENDPNSLHITRALTQQTLPEQERALAELVQTQQAQQAKEPPKKKPSLLSLLFSPSTQHKQGLPSFIRVSDLVTPSSIQIFPWFIRIDGEVEHDYTRTLSLVSYPRSAYPGWFDSIIQIDEPNVDFSIHIVPLPPEVVSARLGRKAVEFRGSVLVSQRQGRTPDPSTSIALEDLEQLRENLARGDERVFSINAFIQVHAPDRRMMMERCERIVSTVRSLDFRALPTHWQHHMGFLSCLPDANNLLIRSRLFGTGAAATFFPFTGSDISMDNGVMFGVHSNGGLIIINPFNSKQLENANLVVFAKSGSGKSFFLKTVSCRLLPTCNVYVIDPEAEYQNLCEQVNGQYVRLSTDSLQINPFELYGTTKPPKTVVVDKDVAKEEGNFFREKLLNLITLLELLLSDEGVLPQKEKAFLYKCLIKTYENRGITMDPATHVRQPPNMQEFFVIMSSALRGDDRFGVGEDTYGLSERLERYLHLFPARTRLSLENRYIDFNIRELNETLKPIGLFIITEFLWTKMRQARRTNIIQKNTIILIDEAWLLMQFRQGAKFLEEFARRIRKYGGGLWCTTQNSDDFLSSDEGKTILAMSTMKFLMKQDSSTIDSVVNTFKLSPGQRSFLLGARRGEGLFSTRTWTQMEVLASPKETEMANTTLILSQPQQHEEGPEQDLDLEKVHKNGSSGTDKTTQQRIIVDSSASRAISERNSNSNDSRQY
jgi:hypothetical protein